MTTTFAPADAPKRPVRWFFDGGPVHDGMTDGTRWNGWPNVWIDGPTRDAVAVEIAADDPEMAAEVRALQPDASGLYSLAYGYTPNIEESPMTDENIRRVAMARDLAADVLAVCEFMPPNVLDSIRAGANAGDFYDSNESTAEAYESAFGYFRAYAVSLAETGEGSGACPTTPEELARCNAAVRLASLLVVGVEPTPEGACAIVAEDDSHGLGQVGGGHLYAIGYALGGGEG
jgi:hypothetical protein